MMFEMIRNMQVTFDAADPHRPARWWAGLVGYRIDDGYDLVAALLDDGLSAASEVIRPDGRVFFADAVAARDPEGSGPRLYFQRVAEPKVAKNRLHLDGEVERLVGLVTTLVGFNSHPGHRWAVMADPEGNELCLH